MFLLFSIENANKLAKELLRFDGAKGNANSKRKKAQLPSPPMDVTEITASLSTPSKVRLILQAIVRGSLGFGFVSTAAFSVWVFGDKWFFHNGGELAMYAGCFVVFAALSGLLLHPLLHGPHAFKRFYGVFIPAFFAYTIAWCVGWFFVGSGAGEWLGSFAGACAFVAVLAVFFQNWRAMPLAALILFITHSAGYFAGAEICYSSLHATSGKLAWGLLYGLGFGAGIGYAFAAMQRPWKQP
jgi:hypothetical protein